MARLSRLTSLLLVATALVALAAVVAPSTARAQVSLQTDELGSYDAPEGFFELEDPRISSTRDGRTLMAATTGEGEELDCTIVVAGDAEATAFDYRYGEEPTACSNVVAHPEGGFFLRGYDPVALEEGEVSGFTARLDKEGDEIWSLHDEEFADDEEFVGSYAQVNPAMAYSPQYDRLLAFSQGTVSGGGSGSSISQGHIVNADDGDLYRIGWEPKQSGTPGLIAGATARTSDGYFLVYIYSEGEQGAHFYAYNGRNNEAFYPLGEQDAWTERFVRQMIHGPDDHIHLLWTPDAEDDQTPPTEISVVDQDEADEVWTERWEAQVEVDFADDPVDLGMPQGMWVGSEHTLLLYQADDQLVLRVIDVTDGSELGVASIDELTEHPPVQILNDEDGGFKILTLDQEGNTFHELGLQIEQSDEEDDQDDSDQSEQEDDRSDDGGCACTSASSSAPLDGALMVFVIAVFSIATRRVFRRLEGSVPHG